jgi:hypothetical protein
MRWCSRAIAPPFACRNRARVNRGCDVAAVQQRVLLAPHPARVERLAAHGSGVCGCPAPAMRRRSPHRRSLCFACGRLSTAPRAPSAIVWGNRSCWSSAWAFSPAAYCRQASHNTLPIGMGVRGNGGYRGDPVVPCRVRHAAHVHANCAMGYAGMRADRLAGRTRHAEPNPHREFARRSQSFYLADTSVRYRHRRQDRRRACESSDVTRWRPCRRNIRASLARPDIHVASG